MLVDTNRRSETANRLLQQKRIDAQCLDTSASLEIIDDDTSRGITYSNRVFVGDRLLCTRNDRRLGVNNGTLMTVIGLNTWRKTISVKLDDGRRTIIPVQKYPHIRLGYAMTVYKAQGSTVPTVLVLANGEKECLPLSYVEATRGVLVTRFYTEKAYLDEAREQVYESRLAKQMSRKPDLRLVTDLLAEATSVVAPDDPHPHSFADHEPSKEKSTMNVQGIPPNFWLVTRPTDRSNLAEVCFPCDFADFVLRCRPKGGLLPQDIYGVYARKDEAVAAATSLLNAMPAPAPAELAAQADLAVNYSGLPSKFWLVTTPNADSHMADICRESDFSKLALYVLFAGLRPKQIIGVYADKTAAVATASKLLQAVRPYRHAAARNGRLRRDMTYWVVVKPPSSCTLHEICLRCDFKEFFVQLLARLRRKKSPAFTPTSRPQSPPPPNCWTPGTNLPPPMLTHPCLRPSGGRRTAGELLAGDHANTRLGYIQHLSGNTRSASLSFESLAACEREKSSEYPPTDGLLSQPRPDS